MTARRERAVPTGATSIRKRAAEPLVLPITAEQIAALARGEAVTLDLLDGVTLQPPQ